MKNSRLIIALSLCAYLLILVATHGSAQASILNAPKAPSNLTTTYYPPLTAMLSWKDNSTDETEFILNVTFRIPKTCSTCKTVWLGGKASYSIPANTTKYNFSMQAGGEYTFSVQARGKSKSGFYDLSTPSNLVILNGPPLAPSNLTVKKDSKNFNLTWKDNSNNEGIFVIAIGYKEGVKVFGYQPDTILAALPASALPSSAKYEIIAAALPASAIPANYKKSGDALPSSALSVLAIPSNSPVKFMTNPSYLPRIISSNLVAVK